MSVTRSVNRSMAVALGSILLFSSLVTAALGVIGEPAPLTDTTVGQTLILADTIGSDSWHPMMAAHARTRGGAGTRIYDVFFQDSVKFQYPPSALLVLDLFPATYVEPEGDNAPRAFTVFMTWMSRLALVLTILGATAILWLGAHRPSTAEERIDGDPSEGRRRWDSPLLMVGLAAALGLLFYPIVRAVNLGQIQVFLTCMVTLGILALMRGHRATAGALLGLSALVKPQYGLALLWGLVRGHRRLTLGMLGVLVAGGLLSVARFGFANHVDYLGVLSFLSRVGESFWPNQSLNGLLQRVSGGDALTFSEHSFPPYTAWIYWSTLLTSIGLIALALWPWRRRDPGPIEVDFCIVIAVATMASPIAWEHHYGVFFAIFAVSLPWAIRAHPFGRWTLPALGLSHLAVTNVVWQPYYIHRNRIVGILGSHIFLGALLLLAMLAVLRARASRTDGLTGPPAGISASGA